MYIGTPRWLSSKEHAYQCRRHRLDHWVRKSPWRGKWHPTFVFLPGKSHGQRSLTGYSPWGSKELDITKRLNTHTEISNVHFSVRPTELSFIFPCFLWKYNISFSGRGKKAEREKGGKEGGRKPLG